jgi:hypothetical protein
MNYEREIGRMQTQLLRLSDRMEWRKAGQTAASVEIWLQCIGGNTLDSGQAGIKAITGTLATTTTFQDPYGSGTLADGLGRAYIWRNGVQGLVDPGTGFVPERVLVVIDARSQYRLAWVTEEWARAVSSVKIGAYSGTDQFAYPLLSV